MKFQESLRLYPLANIIEVYRNSLLESGMIFLINNSSEDSLILRLFLSECRNVIQEDFPIFSHVVDHSESMEIQRISIFSVSNVQLNDNE